MTDTLSSKPTRGQLERTLSQQIQKLYREHLDHNPGTVSCQLHKDKLMVVIEESLTQPEQLIFQEGNSELVAQMRSDLDEAIRPKIIDTVEAVLHRKVIDLMSDTTLATGRTGLVIVLSE